MKRSQLLSSILISLVTLLTLASCASLQNATGSLFESAPKPGEETAPKTPPSEDKPTPPTTKVGIENLAEKKAGTLSDIEVLWQIPTQPVEGFIINYGFDKTALDQHVKIATQDLEKFEDPKYGFVFRYVLGDIPLSKTIYVSIAAYNGSKVSRPSEVFPISGESIMPK